MSFIDHLCECGHPIVMHTPCERRRPVCHCGCVNAVASGESAVIETFTLDGTITPIVAPGSVVPLPLPRLVACRCDTCVALYAAECAS